MIITEVVVIDTMKEDSVRILKRLESIRDKLHLETATTNIASNDIIKTVALSNEIANDIKEVLIILQTTMVTEFTESKISSFKINLDILDATAAVLKLQNTLINNLAILEDKPKPKPKLLITASILKDYKGLISASVFLLLMWLIMLIDTDAASKVIEYIPKLVRGVI